MKKWKLLLLAALSLLLLPTHLFAYSNPLGPSNPWRWSNNDFYGEGDPYILKFNGTYYLYVSTVDDQVGIKVWSSTNLVDWTYRGLCSTEALTKAAYAPEVVYWNGLFYMYTSPGGNGHYVLTSSSPTGPFVPATGNLGMGIDGSVFIDDDGKWYFYSTGANTINVRPMNSPTAFGAPISTGLSMAGWTEGSTTFKRNGIYYMTYTGNHVWSTAYRVDYATSSSPTLAFSPAASQNPVLIDTEGANVGLGHNSIVKGPDLDSDYIVYHSHAHGGNLTYPGRRMNLDRVVWNGDKLVVLGPTTSSQQNPELPDFEDRFNRAAIGTGWNNVGGGTWGIYNQQLMWQDTIGNTSTYRQVTSASSASDYTAEFHLKQMKQGNSANPVYGVVFSYTNESNYGTAVLNRSLNRLETNFVVGGVSQGWQYASLPAGYDYTKWHQLRVEKSGSAFTIFVDGMKKQTRTVSGLGGGKIGYTTTDAHADFGYTAFSNKVGGSSAWNAYKPLPGKIEAVHYMNGGEGAAYHDLSAGNTGGAYRGGNVDIRHSAAEGKHVTGWNQTGEWLKYRVNVAESGFYDLDVRYATTFASASFRLWDGTTDLTGIVAAPNTGGWESWSTVSKKGLYLTAGYHELRFEFSQGEFDFSGMTFSRGDAVVALSDDFNDGNDNGWTRFEGSWSVASGELSSAGGGSFAKTTIGSDLWADYTVESDIKLIGTTGDAGILVRVNNPSNGTVLANNPDYVQGYYAFIKPNGVYLGKMNYGYQALASSTVTLAPSVWHRMKVVASGTTIRVYVGDMATPKITYPDNSANPFTHGKVGLRTMNNQTSFDHFLVTS
ncbi:family 43 glycosylhydrolase [Paenibacillus soyae]|uniref:Family 43 glycosylhydrolase n=1 Tax=Paenibacillus soyae TaxID=2969249 RepID=A0A9X2MU98_9BACL|nr:family 43 glycosylhydrolase [Paenibacillus soyae]MCR2808033.1 family 43 glycosylhydrolase [Paenibacillus soyae]